MIDGRFRSVAAACALALAVVGSTSVRAEEGVTKTWAFAEFGEPLGGRGMGWARHEFP